MRQTLTLSGMQPEVSQWVKLLFGWPISFYAVPMILWPIQMSGRIIQGHHPMSFLTFWILSNSDWPILFVRLTFPLKLSAKLSDVVATVGTGPSNSTCLVGPPSLPLVWAGDPRLSPGLGHHRCSQTMHQIVRNSWCMAMAHTCPMSYQSKPLGHRTVLPPQISNVLFVPAMSWCSITIGSWMCALVGILAGPLGWLYLWNSTSPHTQP